MPWALGLGDRSVATAASLPALVTRQPQPPGCLLTPTHRCRACRTLRLQGRHHCHRAGPVRRLHGGPSHRCGFPGVLCCASLRCAMPCRAAPACLPAPPTGSSTINPPALTPASPSLLPSSQPSQNGEVLLPPTPPAAPAASPAPTASPGFAAPASTDGSATATTSSGGATRRATGRLPSGNMCS